MSQSKKAVKPKSYDLKIKYALLIRIRRQHGSWVTDKFKAPQSLGRSDRGGVHSSITGNIPYIKIIKSTSSDHGALCSTLEDLASLGQGSCLICCSPFEVGDTVSTLSSCRARGCRAVFHRGGEECGGVLRWLETHRTCPLCRTEVVCEIDDCWQDEDDL